MEFLSFCRSLGILIDHPPPIGVWKRYPTEDHPRKRNGAVKFFGTHAFVQNHALDTEVSVWRSENPADFAGRDYNKIAQQANAERLRMQQTAARNAAAILNQCVFGKHDYLKAKGFPEEEGNVFVKDGEQYLVIPMRVGTSLVGLQMIDAAGNKKFLYGQKSGGAEFCFNNKGVHILCEGYATALSVRAAMKTLKRRYNLHVCFSAGNLKKIASTIETPGLVIADCDESGTGERIAKETGWPYWMPDTVGMDANDVHQRDGLFRFSQSLLKSLNSLK